MTCLTSILIFVIFFGKYLGVFWRGILLKLILLFYYVTFVIFDIKLRFSVPSTNEYTRRVYQIQYLYLYI